MSIKLAVTAVFLLALAVSAQDEPVFRTGTRLVQVNVVVRQKNAPAAGLTKEDFTLLEDGKPRTIATFSFTTAQPDGALRKRLGGADTEASSDVVSNRFTPSGEAATTATVLLIDRLNTPIASQPWANGKVVQFLQKHGAGNRIGIYVLGRSLRAIQDLTDDPDRLTRAVARLRPQDARRITADVTVDPTGDAQADAMVADSLNRLEDFSVQDRVTATREALKAIARHLANVPGRKNLIWISAAFPLVIVRDHEVIDHTRDVDEAARQLNDANVAVYPVDPRGLAGAAAYGYVAPAEVGLNSNGGRGPMIMLRDQVRGPEAGIDTMGMLAGLTGGRAFYNTNGIEDSMLEAMQDGDVTYVLGFYPPVDSLDNRFHKFSVSVARKGVQVRARTGYFASTAPETASSPQALRQLLDSPLDATAVGIAASAKLDGAQAGHFMIHAVVDLHDIQLEHENGRATGSLYVSLFVEGARSARTINRKIDVAEYELAAALTAGVVVDNSIAVDNAAREIRVVAQDRATGAAGSVRVALRK